MTYISTHSWNTRWRQLTVNSKNEYARQFLNKKAVAQIPTVAELSKSITKRMLQKNMSVTAKYVQTACLNSVLKTAMVRCTSVSIPAKQTTATCDKCSKLTWIVLLSWRQCSPCCQVQVLSVSPTEQWRRSLLTVRHSTSALTRLANCQSTSVMPVVTLTSCN